MFVLVILMTFVVVWAIVLLALSNNLICLHNKAINKFAQVDIQLRQRTSLSQQVIDNINLECDGIGLKTVEEVSALLDLLQTMQLNCCRPNSTEKMIRFTQVQQQLTNALRELFLHFNKVSASSDVMILQGIKEINELHQSVVYSIKKYNEAASAYNIQAMKHPKISRANKWLDFQTFKPLNLEFNLDLNHNQSLPCYKLIQQDNRIFPSCA